jgi:hypothetical protein
MVLAPAWMIYQMQPSSVALEEGGREPARYRSKKRCRQPSIRSKRHFPKIP